MTDRHTTPDDDDNALAAEYVLGVQDAAERAATERRLRGDAALAARVARWEMDFAAMNDGFAEAAAPDLMPRIEARLFGKPETRAAQARTEAAARRGAGWWRRVLGGAVAAGLLAVLLISALPPPAPIPRAPAAPVLLATLAAEGQPLVWQARYDGQVLTLVRESGEPPAADQAHELWLIEGQSAPVSLGLIDAAETRRDLPALPAGAVLAVSLEPVGGSTTGAPSGPVLVTGVVAAQGT